MFLSHDGENKQEARTSCALGSGLWWTMISESVPKLQVPGAKKQSGVLHFCALDYEFSVSSCDGTELSRKMGKIIIE